MLTAGVARLVARAMWMAAILAGAAVPQGSPVPTTLHYVAHWHLLDAATASLSWQAAPNGKTVRFDADASRLVGLFYPIRDRMQTSYAAGSYCAEQLDNDILEGRRRRRTQIAFNAGARSLTLDESDPSRPAAAAKHEVKPIPGCVFDLFSALDYVRAQPLHVGDSLTFPVNEGGDTKQVRVSVDLKETVTTPAGRFSTVRAEPTLFDHAVFERAGKMWIWFTDDARHLPVQVEAQVSWGTILVQLTP